MKILFIGDIIGKPGRESIKETLLQIKEEENIDFIIANGENSAGGFGITPKVADEIFLTGVDVITLGNHCWDKKEVHDLLFNEKILRPANFPSEAPGRGFGIFTTEKNKKICVINLQGRVFMLPIDCPFRTARDIIEKVKKETAIIIVDIHAEITSEKQAMGWFLDGNASAVIGTHTHVQTSDERILPEGTAYITDVGMTGPRNSVIGVSKEAVIKRFLTGMKTKFDVAEGERIFSSVIIDIDDITGKANSIKRLQKIL